MSSYSHTNRILLSRNASPCLGDCWKLLSGGSPGRGRPCFWSLVVLFPSPVPSVFGLQSLSWQLRLSSPQASQAGVGPLLDSIISCPFFFLPDGRAHDEQQPWCQKREHKAPTYAPDIPGPEDRPSTQERALTFTFAFWDLAGENAASSDQLSWGSIPYSSQNPKGLTAAQ